jgi:hypothetical protein
MNGSLKDNFNTMPRPSNARTRGRKKGSFAGGIRSSSFHLEAETIGDIEAAEEVTVK